jgi:hypothetical protein
VSAALDAASTDEPAPAAHQATDADLLDAVRKEIASWDSLFGNGEQFRRRIESALSRRHLTEALGPLKVRFWVCPIEKHRHNYPEPHRVTVRWIGDIAHCQEPGCFRTSANTTEADYPELQDTPTNH